MAVLGAVIPFAKPQYFDNNGNPLAGGFLYTYAAGTSTPLQTYQDAGLTTPNTNPIELDSSGRANIWTLARTYKLTMTDADGNVLWTQDGVPATNLSQSIVGVGGLVWDFGATQYTPVTSTSYVSGSTYDACDTDTTILSINSSLLLGSFALSGMLYVESGTITVAMVNLSDGAPDTPIATISSSATTGAVVSSTAIPFASPGVDKLYAIKSKMSSGTGYRWGLALRRIS